MVDPAPAAGEHDWQAAGQAWRQRRGPSGLLLRALRHRRAAGQTPTGSASGPTSTSLISPAGPASAVRLADGMGAKGFGHRCLGRPACHRGQPCAGGRPPARADVPCCCGRNGRSAPRSRINGIWGGCETALDEAWRVLRPGGLLGISFWAMNSPRPPAALPTAHCPLARGPPRLDASALNLHRRPRRRRVDARGERLRRRGAPGRAALNQPSDPKLAGWSSVQHRPGGAGAARSRRRRGPPARS